MKIHKLTVTLQDASPLVQRVLEVPADLPLDRLHEVLQAAFGWQNAHLYQFCIGEPYQLGAERWVIPDFIDYPEDRPADQTTLSEALEKAAQEGLTYLYDFGDDWEHVIEAGEATDAKPGQTYPRLTALSGTCPPEDIGGAPGFEMFKEAMANPKHPEHKELKAWYGGPFDPDTPNSRSLKSRVTRLAKSWA